MLKHSTLCAAVLAALAVPFGAQARDFGGIEVNAILKNETAIFTQDGQVTGAAKNMLDDSEHSAGDLMKFENSARLFFNGDLGENASWHGELNLIYDSEAVDHKGCESYTQHDCLRELYVDANAGDWALRIGKQQVVWGTADGIKLLDIINPTDFKELNQNAMEDSRIPVWMLNAERYIGDRGNIQLIVAQHEENKIPGLNSDGDAGHPFIMKGVDTITGRVNGFLNIAPALANTAASFNAAAAGGAFGPSPSGLVPFGGLTVNGFAGGGGLGQTGSGAGDLNGIAQYGLFAGDPNGNDNVTNLMAVTGQLPTDVVWNPGKPTSAFEYMSAATFATFNTFTGFDATRPTGFAGATSSYKRDYPSSSNPNAGFRFRSYTDAGLNYSLNYFYHYSANPTVDMSWHDSTTGEQLQVQRASANAFGIPDTSTNLGVNEIPTDFTAAPPVSILVRNAAGQYYGAFDPTAFDGTPGLGAPTLRLTERTHRIHSIGGSLDYAFDTALAPIVLRGEFLYDKDDKQPVIDKRLLAIGDLTNALKMEDADYFKYVIGADVTVLTNLLVSGQFIQFINLDYEKTDRTCTGQPGLNLSTNPPSPAAAPYTFDCSKYTGDFATLSLDNGMKRGYRTKEWFSLFLSKPFGESQLGRWNNIVIWEEGGGFWNRFDMEYSFTDQLIGSAELNLYFGNDNTTFGQFEDSSNFQLGVKYLLQ
jgi:hypothetical protein